MNPRDWLVRYGTVLALGLLLMGFALTAGNFASPYNLLNILKQISFLWLIGAGFTMALMAGELDLSVASVASLASVCAAALLHADAAWPLAVAASLGLGIALGTLNGFCVVALRIPSLIATLAVASIAEGLSFFITGGVAFVGRLDSAFLALGRSRPGGVPAPVWWLLLGFVLMQFLVKQTRTGIHLVCTGEAEEGARLAGIPTRRIKVLAMALSGFWAAFTGLLLTSNLSSASPTIAGDYLMTGIAAVLLGMTTVEPGKPNLPGTLVGALIIGVLSNGLTLLGAQYYVQDIVLGVIILASVSISSSQLGRAAFGAPR